MNHFVQAAERHLNDAENLLSLKRNDNAVYLAGYVVECAYKSVIGKYINAVAYSHDLKCMEEKCLERLKSLYPQIGVSELIIQSIQDTVLTKGHPERRYEKNGLWDDQEAELAINRAREIYIKAIVERILDGAISSEEM